MAKKFLTLDVGASSVALAEYEASGPRLTLVNYGTAALAAPLDQGDASAILSPAILEIVREKGIRPGKVLVSLSGQMVFPRFAAIPFAGSDESKFDQLVRYEIEQNIPFPMEEMVCDRQVLGETENGDKAVMIVAAKVAQVESVTDVLVANGFTPEVVDGAPLSVMNAVLAASGAGSCIVALDIGAKTASLVIVEGEKVYIRSIPYAGNTITKDIAQALGCTQDEAEGIKREQGYVSMGGVTEDEDPVRDKVSKVCRTVLTRLHAEISRSINFYRSQQGGGTPVKLYLTGGTALLPQIDAFFADSLGIEVEFLNPFGAMAVAPSVDGDALSADAAFLAAGAGLAFREAGLATFTMNLLPQSLIDARAEVRRIPFVALSSVAFVAAVLLAFFAVSHSREVVEFRRDSAQRSAERLRATGERVSRAAALEKESEEVAGSLKEMAIARGSAVARLNTVRAAIGDDLWIESWQDGKIVVRGWKDRVAAFAEKVSKREGSGGHLTAPDIVLARLKASPVVASATVGDMRSFGKDGCLEQFTVEISFK